MTREEEIQKAACEYACGVASAYSVEEYTVDDFTKGAEWADEHPSWKPTEEQLEDLKYAINMVDKCCEDSLQSLYDELKKL